MGNTVQEKVEKYLPLDYICRRRRAACSWLSVEGGRGRSWAARWSGGRSCWAASGAGAESMTARSPDLPCTSMTRLVQDPVTTQLPFSQVLRALHVKETKFDLYINLN